MNILPSQGASIPKLVEKIPKQGERVPTEDPQCASAGEYPMTGAQAAEKEIPGSKADMLHRGRNVALAFTMQVRPDIHFGLTV